MSASATENQQEQIYLVGETICEITGNKLPSRKQVLQYMLFLNAFRRDPYESAKETFDSIEPFWTRAGLPIMEKHKAALKIKNYFESYRELLRSSKNKNEKSSATFKNRELQFVESLDDIFDIVHQTNLLVASAAAQNFLTMQRMKGRPGTIPIIVKIPIVRVPSTTSGESLVMVTSRSTVASSSNIVTTSESTLESEQRSMMEMEMMELDNISLGSADVQTQTPESSLFSDSASLVSLRDDPDYEVSRYFRKQIPSSSPPHDPEQVKPPAFLNKHFLTERLLSEMDRYKISDYAAVHLFAAVMEGLGLDSRQFVFSRSTLYNKRSENRKVVGEDVKEKFKFESKKGSTVHWDGKIMENISTHEKHDRLPIKITHDGTDQLLGVPELKDGTGFTIAEKVFETLDEWNQLDKIECCCFDTTSTNTGCRIGAALRLEQLIGRPLLYIPCRHHIAEVVLRAVFELKVTGATTAPDVAMFKTFQKNWNQLNQDRYVSGMHDRYVRSQLRHENLELLKVWIRNQLEKQICRLDYREFLELCLLFLGEGLPNAERRRSTFHRPGPVHHARWMAKAIYCLKMFLFKDQIELSEKEKVGMADVCVFIIRFYVTYWFRCPRAIEAPLQDLTFLKNVVLTRDVDPELADEVVRKFVNHLWYLSEESVALSFFDKKVPVPEKREMVKRLKYNPDPEEDPQKRIIIKVNDVEQFIQKNLRDFVTAKTLKFFERFDISLDFLDHDPATWMDREDFSEARKRLKLMKVVNDTAERGVKLMSDFNKIFSRDEQEKQFILLTVSKYRDQYKSYHKKDLVLDEH